jgi:uncharacterized protein (DUF2147 family)
MTLDCRHSQTHEDGGRYQHRSSIQLAMTRFILPLLLAATAHATVLGDWRTPTGAVIRLAPCGNDFCLTLVQLDPSPRHTTDIYNPDASLHTRPLCGLTIGSAFHLTDPDHLDSGWLYDPKSGHTYRGTVAAIGDTLKLHGYIGIALFGRTETWQRTPTIEACKK